MCALEQKKNDFPDIYLLILKATQLPPKIVFNKNAKAKDRATLIPFIIAFNIWKGKTKQLLPLSRFFSKSKKVRRNKLYSRGRAAFSSIQNLSKASGLSKKRVEQFSQTRTSYTKFQQSGVSEDFKFFLKKFQWNLVYGLGFCRQVSWSKQ